MQKLHFSIVINAPREKVWNVMLNDETYRQWAATFMPGSHAVGSWEEGSKIQFLAHDEDGKLGGMTSKIVKNIPHEFISIKHMGIVSDGVEDTTSEEAKNWVGFENYTFREVGGQTELLIDMDSNNDFAKYLKELWPKALLKLKEIVES